MPELYTWWIVAFSALITLFYALLIIVFSIGWRRLEQPYLSESNISDILISVIVPCRNEEGHIEALLFSLKNQKFQHFELLLVNDHSVDATCDYILEALKDFANVRLIDASGFGKKNALREGIMESKGDFIVTTDADCVHPERWLESIAAFQTLYHCDLLILPVKLVGNDSVFFDIQQLEFVSLVASGAGATGAGMPILCNGANLAFPKEIWMRHKDDLHEEEQSGDDIFLLEKVKQERGVIKFLKSEHAFAFAGAADTLGDLFRQRRRWTSKAPAYSDWQLIFTACVIFSISLVELVLFVLSAFDYRYLMLLISVFAVKYVIDSQFLYSVSTFFQLKRVWFNAFLLSIVYPFYIVAVAVSSLFLKPKQWK